MPFTFSHPAIVLPFTFLHSRYYSLTGLVIGSMAPDFEYFIRLRAGSDFSHTIVGIFWFNLPIGILLAFIFHNIVRNPLIDHLPHIFRSRFYVFREFEWNVYFRKNFLIVSISIIIGAASHIFWDSFTHYHGYFVEKIPELQGDIYGFPIYRLIQHFSTVIGAIVILYAINKMPKAQLTFKPVNLSYWIFIFSISLITAYLRKLSGISILAYSHLIISAISGFLIGLIFFSWIRTRR
jgi:hypothetical protein